jgi:hypothetical protein
MANPIDRGELGIVFYGSTAVPLPTYVDINGNTQTAVQISGSTLMPPEVDTAFFHVGGVSRFTLQVDVTAAPESEVDLDLGLVGHFDQDPTARFGALRAALDGQGRPVRARVRSAARLLENLERMPRAQGF